MISVIIPVYNVEDYLYVCINSVLKQSYDNFEIICINDASTDSSLEILEYFAQKDSRVKIIKNESNMGPGYSRNNGLDVAQGKYIAFLDGDDWLAPDALEILVNKAEQDNLDFVMFKNIAHYEDHHEFGMEAYYDMEFMNNFADKVFNHWDLDKTRLFKIPNGPCNKLYLKSFLDENNIRFPKGNLIHEDNPFFYKLITSAERVSLIDKYLYNRRRRPNSITTLNNERIFDNIEVMYKVLDVFFEDKELYEYYKKEVLTYIFSSVFKGKYDQIDDELKDKFFKEVQGAYKVYIMQYGLYNDIKENVPKRLLDFFKFEDIISEILYDSPKISVVIPIHNVEMYIRECLDSVINQTFEDFEIICVDEGATDDSLNILKEYQKNVS